MPKTVIFDVDGTLIDTVDLHAASWRETFRHYGHETSHEEVRRQIGKGGDQIMPVFLPQELVASQGEAIEAFRKELFLRDYLPRARAFPGVRALFERLRADGRQILLASSGKADELARYADIAGISDLVDATISSDDAERSKPDPDIFAAALARIAPLGPADAIAVGDTPYDAEAAGKAGLRTVGVLCGGFPRADLLAAGCVAIYWDPEDLLRHYETAPLADVAAATKEADDTESGVEELSRTPGDGTLQGATPAGLSVAELRRRAEAPGEPNQTGTG